LNPVFGGTIALVSTILALCLLLVLFYTTVNQMRPVVIIEAIRQHVLAAREVQIDLLRKTRRSSSLVASLSLPAKAVAHGFVDVESISPRRFSPGQKWKSSCGLRSAPRSCSGRCWQK